VSTFYLNNYYLRDAPAGLSKKKTIYFLYIFKYFWTTHTLREICQRTHYHFHGDAGASDMNACEQSARWLIETRRKDTRHKGYS